MDDYELQQELEALAGNAFDPPPADETSTTKPEPISTTISRWQTLFNLSQDEATDRIMEHRQDLTRTRVTDEHWETVRLDREAAGYDREAYEYDLALQKKAATLPTLLPASTGSEDRLSYLVEMTGPLDSPENVQHAAGTDQVPDVVSGFSVEDGRPVLLCCVDGRAKAEVLRWTSEEGTGFGPTILVDPRSMR